MDFGRLDGRLDGRVKPQVRGCPSLDESVGQRGRFQDRPRFVQAPLDTNFRPNVHYRFHRRTAAEDTTHSDVGLSSWCVLTTSLFSRSVANAA